MPDRSLRILQILRAPIGGLFRHVVDLTQALAERGHEVGVVIDSLSSDEQTARKLAPLRDLASLGIHSFPMPRLLGMGDLTTPLAIRKLARQLDVQVLHGHGAKGGLNARLARLGSRKRVALYTPHGGVLHFEPGTAVGRLFHRIERGVLNHTDAIIFESAYAKAVYGETIADPPCPAPVIHNGLAAMEFENVPVAEDAFDFVYIGEFRHLKGITHLIDALAEVKAPDGRPATLIMAGGGPDKAEAEAQIARLGLGERIHLAGVQPARDMLRRGRCLLVPSLAESLPYVVLEGAAARRPVIATRVGGIAEIFGPTAERLITAGDTDALRQAMQAFMDDPRHALEEAGERHAFIRNRFSLEAMTDSIESLYRRSIAKLA